MPSDATSFKQQLILKLESLIGKSTRDCNPSEVCLALSMLAREYLSHDWLETKQNATRTHAKQMYYFSMEFLIGKMLPKNLKRLGLYNIAQDVITELGFDFDAVLESEPDAGLGNGGLGRLAACFMDSLASCDYNGHGNGIRYTHGLFRQRFENGYQVEESDNWLSTQNPWEICKTSDAVEVKFYGNVREEWNGHAMLYQHENYESVMAIPYDTPLLGYDNKRINTLRLWQAEPKEDTFDFHSFSRGDYGSAVAYRQSIRAISDVLYPDDSNAENKALRLKQQYFFVCAGLTRILADYVQQGGSIYQLDQSIAIHINDTHPALAVPELMRLLIDTYHMGWDDAWRITTATLSYTNHTLLPEALEKWPTTLFQHILPRIMQITVEIDRRFNSQLHDAFPGDTGKIAYMAIIEQQQVKMGNLCVVGTHSTNGVAKIHSQLLKDELFRDFYLLYPERFNNKTNGITHRRWLLDTNPRLTRLLRDSIGDSFIHTPIDLEKIITLNLHQQSSFLDQLKQIKYLNKLDFCRFVKKHDGTSLNPYTLFDVQVKRFHAYKRQLLKILQIIDLYLDLKTTPELDIAPTTFIFGGKAAPGYRYAKLVIHLIHVVAQTINQDNTVNDKLRIYFIENYNVSSAQRTFPASDISEQLSTATKEASGTGNMKFMLNGALTLGTMDGANIEIAEAVGESNIFTFGLSVADVLTYNTTHTYNSRSLYEHSPRIKRVVDTLINGTFTTHQPQEFKPIYDELISGNDAYFVLADFEAYRNAWHVANTRYKTNPMAWYPSCAINIARAGRFSSDQTITHYAQEIWHL